MPAFPSSRPLLAACLLCAAVLPAADPPLSAATFIGAAGEESVNAAAFQPDGSMVVAGTVGAIAPTGVTPVLLNGATATSAGAVLRLSGDGRTVLSMARVSAEVFDVAVDGAGRIHVAAGAGGYLVLDAAGTAVVRTKAVGYVRRVDASADGHAAILKPTTAGQDSTPGAGTVYVYGPDGAQLGQWAGHRNTLDLCLDQASSSVLTIGWRQANAWDGAKTQPVQIAYLRGSAYDGTVKWTGYDWSTDKTAADFINKPENNMADTRGYRIALGGDGKAYAAFECAGGNSIFRYSPFSITTKVAIVGGDKYHAWYNTKSEHKTFFARYEPATGAYLRGQQFCARLSSGAGNTVRVKNGAIAADAAGRVYVTGAAAYGLPLSWNPLAADAYTGGAYVLVMSADFTQRLLCTRLTTGGSTEAVAVRADGAFALAGNAKNDLHRVASIQDTFGGGTLDGSVIAFSGTPTVSVNAAPSVNAGPDRAVTLPAAASLDGTVSDDGMPSGALTQQWSKVSGPGTVTFASATAVDTTATFSVAGTYVLRLTASDGALSAQDDVQVVVSAAAGTNAAPTVSAGPDRAVTLPAAANLDGTVSDDGQPSGTLTRQWSKVSGPGTVTFAAATAADTTATFSVAGTYVLRLTASDGALSAQDEVQVVVAAAPTGGGPVAPIAADGGGGGGGGCGAGSAVALLGMALAVGWGLRAE